MLIVPLTVLAGGLLAALSEVNEPSGAGPCAGGFANRAKAFFAAHGFPGIVRIATDNGACYRAHDFARVLHDAGASGSPPARPATMARSPVARGAGTAGGFAAGSVLVLRSGANDHFGHGHGVSVTAGEF